MKTNEEYQEMIKTLLGECERLHNENEELKKELKKALENHDMFMKYAYSQGKQDALSQEKSGKWIDIEDSNFSKCSECGAETPMYFDPYGHGKGITVVETSYCPNCGAKMESEDKE